MSRCADLKATARGVTHLFPPKPKFSIDQIPDLTGRVCIVTGGNSGIGKETIRALLQHNAKVYMATRSKARAEAAIQELKESTGREAIFLELDLSSLTAVRKAAEEFMRHEEQLHILFNNAGVMWVPTEMLTADGYDLQFGTNVIGHWYFTKLLVPVLARGASTSPDGHARVVNTSSSSAYFATLQWDTFTDTAARKKLSTQTLYNQSKFGNVVVACEAARRYADKNIISMSVDPGLLKTELQRHTGTIQHWLVDRMLHPAPLGALTQLWGGTMPETLKYNGEFLVAYARLGKCRDEAYDPKIGQRLWTWLEDQVKQT